MQPVLALCLSAPITSHQRRHRNTVRQDGSRHDNERDGNQLLCQGWVQTPVNRVHQIVDRTDTANAEPRREPSPFGSRAGTEQPEPDAGRADHQEQQWDRSRLEATGPSGVLYRYPVSHMQGYQWLKYQDRSCRNAGCSPGSEKPRRSVRAQNAGRSPAASRWPRLRGSCPFASAGCQPPGL
jgi:hypothetical protein